ncbi:stimulated by retinoic acid gene 6 protein-like [Mizuhopecten yessoensis]|nr:stimulated by retinoic acid gene 6 protein-like [Mizuhopecten yessoensis]
MASAVVIGTTYYPLFVCLAPTFRFVHSTIGLGYATVCLVISLLPMNDYSECLPTSEWIWTMTLIMLAIPHSLCLFYLALRFLCMFATDVKTTVRACRQRNFGLIHREQVPTCTNKRDRLANSKQIQHVRELFMRTDEPTTSGKYISRFVDTIQLSYKGDRAFRYSHHMVVTFTVALICLYQISTLVLGEGTFLIQYVEELISKNTTDSIFSPNFDHITGFNVLKASFYVSFTITTLMSGVVIFQIMISYRKNLEALYKGDFSCVPIEARQQSAVTVMTNSLHYSGIQIAYLFWSYVIQLGVLLMVCICVAYAIVLPILGDVPMIVLNPFLTVITTSVIAFVTYWLQTFVSRKWLLQDHKVTNKDSKWPDPVLALNNRKAYHNMAYFVFFYYIFISMVRCLMKIFYAVYLGVVFFGRIDRSGLMNGFETWDTGYMAYVSFLQMELVHCHPVLVVFCDLLSHRLPGNIHVHLHRATSSLHDTTRSGNTSISTTFPVPKYNQRIHNRWLKVYTLLKNPSLAVK